jgi:predicted N-formylglutamate amidohydrolase
VGPLTIDPAEGRGETRSLCLVLDGTIQDLPKQLNEAKAHVHEIIAIDAGAREIDRQIAEVFGAQIYPADVDPAIEDPWALALQISKGDTKIRLSVEG